MCRYYVRLLLLATLVLGSFVVCSCRKELIKCKCTTIYKCNSDATGLEALSMESVFQANHTIHQGLRLVFSHTTASLVLDSSLHRPLDSLGDA